MLVAGLALLLVALAVVLELCFGATARRRAALRKPDEPARLEGGGSHLR